MGLKLLSFSHSANECVSLGLNSKGLPIFSSFSRALVSELEVFSSTFFNTLNPEDDLEQRFNFFYDYEGSAQLIGSVKATAVEEIFERITQDIFNATLAKW